MIKAVSMVVSLVVVVFIIVLFVMVIFVIAHCRTMHDIAPHGATAGRFSFPHQLLFKKVALKTSVAMGTPYFYQKNACIILVVTSTT